MKPREMGIMWLRDRAKALRTAATKAEKAYSSGELAEVCARVAAAYRRAAWECQHEADRIEDEEINRE